MSNIKKSYKELIGNTPLFELTNIKKKYNLKGNILAKLEYFNPAGSVKDRVGLAMIEDAETKGLIKENATVIEPTSGNTGIGIAAAAVSKGYKAIIVMPDNMSAERRKLIAAYGAQLVLSPGENGMKGAIEKAEEIHEATDNSVILGQFDNCSNPQIHRETTAVEIWDDTDGNIDAFVAGVGSGGTLTGVGSFLKEKNKDIKVYAVEPKSSPVLHGDKAGAHEIQGIGANFIPKVLDTNVYDDIIDVENDDAYKYSIEVAKTEGVLVGISSGAALCAGIKLAQKEEFAGKNIVVIFPDTGERYLSTKLFPTI